jgi:MFS superfamily sulfate permease-like transporter
MNAINVPKDGLAGFKEHLRADILSGFLVFLIALPLCIGISIGSGFGPLGGLFTAIIGGVVVTFLAGSPLAIKGPAAGLMPIAFACVEAFGGYPHGYPYALAVVVAAGVLQTLFGLLRAGTFSDIFSTAPVHGMLAAIGILIVSKEFHEAVGVKATATSAIGRIAEIPHSVLNLNPAIAMIGALSLLILLVLPRVKHRLARMVPGPLVVLAVAVPLGLVLDLHHAHTYSFNGHEYALGPQHLVHLDRSMVDSITFPDFSRLFTVTSIEYILLFSLIGSIESIASAKAIDTLDPYKRKSNFNRDLVAIGVGNTAAGLVGGLPMISEIVRSSANVNSGAKTRWSNFWHGLFLLIVIALIPWTIAYIPRAALGAMLVFTGLRLAAPTVLVHMARIGREQLFLFIVTITLTLVEDLLVGIMGGIVAKLIIQVINGAPPSSLFKATAVARDEGEDTVRLVVDRAAVFSNLFGLKRHLERIDPHKHVIVDFAATRLVDHTTVEYMHDLQQDYARVGRRLVVTGLEHHTPMSAHRFAARKRAA